jgi:hypothetical protein
MKSINIDVARLSENGSLKETMQHEGGLPAMFNTYSDQLHDVTTDRKGS